MVVDSDPTELSDSTLDAEDGIDPTRMRLLPGAVRSGTANVGLVTWVIAAVLLGPTLLWAGLTALPGGAILWLFAALLFGWATLCGKAIAANKSLGDLEKSGHVVGGQIVAVTPSTEQTAEVTWAWTVSPLEDDDVETTHEGAATVSGWSARRYEPKMSVFVIFDPDAPDRASLYPPPGGGGPLDVAGDCVAQILRHANAPKASLPQDEPDGPL